MSEHVGADGAGGKGHDRGVRAVVFLLILLLAAGIVIFGVLLGTGGASGTPTPPAVSPGAAGLGEQAGAPVINYTLNQKPRFENGRAEGTLALSVDASSTVPLQFVITRDDNGEVLYDSGVLAPNSYIYDDQLQTKRTLSKGELACTVTIFQIDPATGGASEYSKESMVITIEN